MSVGIESGFSNDEVLCARFPLHRACRDGDVRALCSLLQLHGGRAEIHTEDSLYGWTPIHWAAHFGKLECVLRLVEVGCEVNSVTTRFGQTPAHIAAFGGHPECLLWLLQAGADINRQDFVGEAPIHKSARAGSMECVNALLISGATPELRNTNGLTAADLARAQGFHECAQLLFNAANQLRQLNGFGRNGTEHACIKGRSLLNGVTNRKRLHECSEFNRVKKARVDGVDFPVKTINGTELESMHVESTSASQSDGTIETATGLSSGYMQKSYTPNGHCQPLQPLAESDGDMCGSLHLSGSPGGCTSQRPAWATFPSDVGNHLHYGYYHGFGDTAEDLEDAASHHEHCKTVKLEQHYHQEVVHAMLLFHGS
ncbi:ankyrin repeat domain-containing protein 10a [Trichomycterus rosablanca]|uniref:ankyrin repeat domain-containing protein 10a n=1 Tax=Trichomycterus rosablanca TaxID=2290929 RepID=UPI002F358129